MQLFRYIFITSRSNLQLNIYYLISLNKISIFPQFWRQDHICIINSKKYIDSNQHQLKGALNWKQKIAWLLAEDKKLLFYGIFSVNAETFVFLFLCSKSGPKLKCLRDNKTLLQWKVPNYSPAMSHKNWKVLQVN